MRLLSRAILVLLLCLSSLAAAQEPNVEEAKRLFEQGEALRAGGQYQAALEAYLKSRAIVARATNTLNVAVCLHALKRYDEAYDFFEEALSKYPEGQLSAEARDSAKKTLADIETRVGRLDVSANVDATLVIDGRTRGKLPLLAPVRVMPGKRLVRVLRDGFATFEQTVTVVERETTKLDAKLEPLTAAGRLRIEGDPELEGGNVVIDGAVVGAVPWEGTLAPGAHVYFVNKGELGAGPELAIVIVGQTVKSTVKGKALGPERRIVVDPATAALSIDGVALGKGRFQGRLPVGAHVVEAREEGYVSARVPLEVTAADSSDFAVKLTVDPNHPRWGVSKGRFALELFGGYALASSFGNDSTAWCRNAASCEGGSVAGPRFGAGGVYELASGFGVHLQLGYFSLARTMSRSLRSSFRVGTTDVAGLYELDDSIRVTAFFASVGVGYRVKLGSGLDVLGRVLITAARASAVDTIKGRASGGGRTLTTQTTGSGSSFDGIMLEAMPEVTLGLWLTKSIRAGLGLSLPVSLLRGPRLNLGDTFPDDPERLDCSGATPPATIDCAAGKTLDPPDMPVSSLFVRIQPVLGVGYWF